MVNLKSIKYKAQDIAKHYAIEFIKDKFTITEKYRYMMFTNKKFLSFLKRYDPLFKYHITKDIYDQWTLRNNLIFIVKIDKATFLKISTTDDPIEKELYVTITYFGKNSYKVYQMINLIDNENYNKNKDNVVKYNYTYKNINGNIKFCVNTLEKRSDNTVFLNNGVYNALIHHVEKFFKNKDMYSERHIKYKTGILLYGDPGTGKSTIINMLSTKYNCNVITIPMYSFEDFDVDEFSSIIEQDGSTYIIALEDIDCIISNRTDGDKDDQKIINRLLQLLDSASSPSNVIFIATTNHIDKLDSAITRDGRFDLKLNIDYIDKQTASKMVRSFGIKDNLIEQILDNTDHKSNLNGIYRYNPSSLQNSIIKVLKTYQ